MKTKTKLLIIMIIMLFLTILININVYATDESFTLSDDSLDIVLNGNKLLLYKGGSGSVTWKSEDTNIATIEDGIITGKEIGTTTITATRGEETATCKVNIIYSNLTIHQSFNNTVTNVNLVLNEHDTENLYANVLDANYETVKNANISWSSSDKSIVTVDNNGTIKGIKVGTASITATAAGVTYSCKIKVVNSPKFTDFSNAKSQLLFDTDVDLKITGISAQDKHNYYYIITPDKNKPTLSKTKSGRLDTESTKDVKSFLVNTDEKYIYSRNLDKYVELNQDLYLWIIEDVPLEDSYMTEDGNNSISYSTKFVVEGEKLTRPELPQLNLILQSFLISGGTNDNNNSEYTSIRFRFPSSTENRKFKLKIGKVTDNSILKKIQNNDYSGITDLLVYAKNNNAIYSADLTTVSSSYYKNDKALFDGLNLLQHNEYYYIYAEFDNESGKYYPIEGITLGQAWISSTNKYWDIYAYTSDDFKWNDLSPTPIEDTKKEETDTTKAPGNLPHTGTKLYIFFSIIVLISGSIFIYRKYNNLKGI